MSANTRNVTFTADPTDDGKRLDQVLAVRVPDLSRRRARVLLDLGGVFVDGKRTKMAGRLVRRGQKIVAHVGSALDRATKETGQGARARDEECLPAYQILHEDEDIVVVFKPAGLLTAPTPESDRNNLAGLLARRPGADGRILVVHRLDLPTSGVLVFAKNEEANIALGERFRTHDLTRQYLGVVKGAFPAGLGRLDTQVQGKRAVTHAAVEERFGDRATLIRFTLETGRTHQIRIHCRAVGHPVLGDSQYGIPGPDDAPRLALHAAHLAFAHPRTGAPMSFTVPMPEDLTLWIDRRLRRSDPVGTPAR